MNLNIVQKGRYGFLLACIMVLAFIFADVKQVHAQCQPVDGILPNIPVLSLTGDCSSWEKENWYPDGRIWLPASANGPREFLLPVFILNDWKTKDETRNIYQADPIYSFSFKVLYDSSALRAIGVQKFGPKDAVLGKRTVAYDFNLSWMDDKDLSYKTYLNAATPDQDKWKGRAVKITGTSTRPLPNNQEMEVLVYIRFRVIPEDGKPFGTAQATPLYIKNDTITYNNLNVRANAPFENYRPVWQGRDVSTDFPSPSPDQYQGLAGPSNYGSDGSNNKWVTEPMLPGVIYLRFSDRVPQFDARCERGIGQIPAITQFTPEFWDLRDTITIDSASYDPIWATRRIQLLNSTSASRMLDITAETDQDWLLIRAVTVGTQSQIPKGWGAPTRKPEYPINWMDNGILGDAQRGTPMSGVETPADKEIHLEIRCDPTRLEPAKNAGEAAGIYVGYITFKSPTALVNPIRLRVTFIYFRNPVEWYNTTRTPGIHLTVKNSRGIDGDSKDLIFGTGHRATMGVDSLFGEYAYEYDMANYDVRFYPPASATDEQKALVPFGFGDFNANDEQHRSNSRDIRNINDTTESIIYLVKVKEDTAAYYPLRLEWDISDFPDGASLFIRDLVNGAYFPAVDMRKATSLGGTKFGFTIQDARVKEFVIEYTLPKVINYVDENGDPIIKKGWNLLSLPVRPTNSVWNVFYPNAINKPYYFSQNQYQDEVEMRVGVGYFIKYGNAIDTKFAGTFIPEIVNPIDKIRVYPGWNTVGCVSAPVNVRDVQFTNFGLYLPTQNFTRKAGIWAYKTDNGYIEISEMVPGLGYWLKADNDGYFHLKAPGRARIANEQDEVLAAKESVFASSTKLTLRDNAQHETNLFLTSNDNIDMSQFEMPPTPPVGLFDARLNSGSKVANTSSSVIRMQGVDYPMALQVTNADAKYVFVDAFTNEVLGTVLKGSSSSIEIKSTKANAIKVLKTDVSSAFSIESYPNPVQTTSNVRFSVPENGNVTVKLYDVMGFEVATLFNGYALANEYTVTLNAANLVNGTYLCKIVAGNNTAVHAITVTK